MNIKFTFVRDDSRLGGWIKTDPAPSVDAATAIAVRSFAKLFAGYVLLNGK